MAVLAEPTTPYRTTVDIHALLERHFGYKSFRPQQEEVVRHVLAGKDAVVLMPTGGGKSLCYQVPALALDGLTVVVSPLIALMKDQVQALQANGISAAFLNSTVGFNEERLIMQQLRQGDTKLLYLAPERLFQPGFLDTLGDLHVALFAIDEAHCISSWGHSFRPEYKELHILKKRFPEVPVIALTATADKAVRGDIAQLLGISGAEVFLSSFDRPNLSLAVLPGQDRWGAIQRILARHAGHCGIIYCNSRAGTEKLAAKLQGIGINATHYHARMEPTERDRVQDAFIQGQVHVICATIAFGMGIDKGDVRFVLHYNMPGTLEGYYQEIGRAGRDGGSAETILFYSYADVQTHMHFQEEIADPQYRAIAAAKLERMKEFAEAQVCRRRVLLSYFSEATGDACGNCDVCRNPPKYFDGTVLAQKALSAVVRSRQTIGMGLLIDVLKGTHSHEVQERGLHTIKTFSAGADVSAFGWALFIQQFVQHGLVEIDYRDHYVLKLTPTGERVLKGDRSVRLISPDTVRERQENAKRRSTTKPAATATADTDLLSSLKALRKRIAAEIGKPAFVVFSDASLTDMAAKQPTTITAFRTVSGVGDHKAELYGPAFTEAIRAWGERG